MIALVGAKDYIEQRGFVIQECPACRATGVFSVYDTKRKLTLYLIPTVSVRSQQIVECMTCHGRWGVPDDARAVLAERLMTQEEVAARVRELHAGTRQAAVASGNGRTYYQVLQVDPDAEPEVIEAAFKRLALKYHPDRSTAPDAARRTRDLLEAKNVLANPAKRRTYDRSIGIIRRTEALRPEEV